MAKDEGGRMKDEDLSSGRGGVYRIAMKGRGSELRDIFFF
jgi:hypothetical protein